MILEVNKNRIEFSVIIIDGGSLQAWGKNEEDGTMGGMVINIPSDNIKRIIVETEE